MTITYVKSTETLGLYAEMILCKIHGLSFISSREYIKNLKLPIDDEITKSLLKLTKNLKLTSYIGHKNKNYDFLSGDIKISVKTNISGYKCCPPGVGQSTLKKLGFKTPLEFKKWVLENPAQVFDFYSKQLFDADFTIYINFADGYACLIPKQNFKEKNDNSLFTFTKDESSWKESCSMKLYSKTIAEFQVHNNRNSIKCRLSMDKILNLCVSLSSVSFKKIIFKVSKNVGTFNYIGSKTKLLDFIRNSMEEYMKKPISEINTFYDLFSGTGVVSKMMLDGGCRSIITNDNMYYSYILCSCLSKKNIDIKKVSSYIDILNSLSPFKGFITDTYACNRMYFTIENASKIDSIRSNIEINKKDYTLEEYNLLLKILLYSSTKVANISSTYGAFLKKYKKSSTVPIRMEKTALDFLYENPNIYSFKSDVLEFVSSYDVIGDVTYIDPPYNSRKYSSNYFVIDLIAKYDKKPVSTGVTGIPIVDTPGSDNFCHKSKAYSSFDTLFSKINTRYLFMSYNSESIISKEDVISLLEKNLWKDIKVFEKEYQRFKSNSKTTQEKPLYEYIYCATRT